MVVEQVMSAQMAGKLKSPLMKELNGLRLWEYRVDALVLTCLHYCILLRDHACHS
jgi:hypothetical protein